MKLIDSNMKAFRASCLEFVGECISGLTEAIDYRSPVEYTQAERYIPRSVSPRYPGYINYDLVPYFIEILECMDVRSPVREVAVRKGVQIAYTTILESIIFYLAGVVRTAPGMYVTADLGLSAARVVNNILPMFQQSGMSDIFRSSDVGNSRKQGVTKAQLQWLGGGYLLPYGAQSAAKARQATILFMLMDELDGWPIEYARDGDPIRLFKDRCSGVWPIRKIFMGSTPLLEGSSHIDRQWERGDQRVYKCRCLKCGFPQELRFAPPPGYEGKPYGLLWDYRATGTLDLESVRYACSNCQNAHLEHDKPKFINKDNCYWEPTSTPVEPGVRSYHIPALLSPVGMQPWYKCVSAWLEAWDPETKRVRDHSKMRTFYNNILGSSYRIEGQRLLPQTVSTHRRPYYRKGMIPTARIFDACGGPIIFLTCTVDTHHDNLAVAVWGWTAGFRCWMVDYFRLYDDTPEGCESLASPVWIALSELIETRLWEDDEGVLYNLKLTLVDARWSTATVTAFCAQYASGVYAIMGIASTGRSGGIREFSEWTTQIGTIGYKINVDYYKDRIAPVLQKPWTPELGAQEAYTVNLPSDTTDAEIRELTTEYKRELTNPNGMKTHVWYRPSGVPNELWDLLVYGHASVEIIAWSLCRKEFDLDVIDWPKFWGFAAGFYLSRVQ